MLLIHLQHEKIKGKEPNIKLTVSLTGPVSSLLAWVIDFTLTLLAGSSSWYVTSHSGQLSLAIPPWVGAMSSGDDFGHRRGRNSELCVTVGPVRKTASILI